MAKEYSEDEAELYRTGDSGSNDDTDEDDDWENIQEYHDTDYNHQCAQQVTTTTTTLDASGNLHVIGYQNDATKRRNVNEYNIQKARKRCELEKTNNKLKREQNVQRCAKRKQQRENAEYQKRKHKVRYNIPLTKEEQHKEDIEERLCNADIEDLTYNNKRARGKWLSKPDYNDKIAKEEHEQLQYEKEAEENRNTAKRCTKNPNNKYNERKAKKSKLIQKRNDDMAMLREVDTIVLTENARRRMNWRNENNARVLALQQIEHAIIAERESNIEDAIWINHQNDIEEQEKNINEAEIEFNNHIQYHYDTIDRFTANHF